MEDDKKKRKTDRQSISIKEKLDAVNQIKEGASKTEIANKLKVHPTTVRTWVKNATSMVKLCNQGLNPAKRLRSRLADNYCVDEAMWIWYQERRDAGIPLNASEIRYQALDFHKVLGGKEEFLASEGWFSKWKRRHNIRFINSNAISGKQLSADLPAAEEFKVSFAKLIDEENLSCDQIFNCCEAIVNFKRLPQVPPSVDEMKESTETKKNKELYTVMACSNASATMKLPLMIIGKIAKPNAIKNWSNCPVYYNSQENARIDSNLFKIWFHEIFVPTITDFLQEKKLPVKAVLFVEDRPEHPRLQVEDIRVEFFPQCTAPFLQPMDQGIFKCLMTNYRKKLMVDLLYKGIRDYTNLHDAIKAIDLNDTISWLSEAWEEVSDFTITKSWKQIWSGVSTSQIMESSQTENEGTMDIEENDETNEKTFDDLAKRFYQHLSSENSDLEQIDVDEWLYNPKKRDIDSLSSDQEIIDFISCGGTAQDEIIPEDKSFEQVSLDEAKICIDKLLLYCDRNRKSNNQFKEDLKAMYQLKDEILLASYMN